MATVSIKKDFTIKKSKKTDAFIEKAKNQKPYKKQTNIKIEVL